MNKLESQFYVAIHLVRPVEQRSYLDKEFAKIAAKIALEIAEKAYNTGFGAALDSNHTSEYRTFEDFKKEVL